MKSQCLPIACLESLEPRMLLSGTVATVLSNGNLSILGDANSNDITIVKVGNTVTITGNDGEVFSGLGNEIENVIGTIKVVMGNGDDRVTIGEEGERFWVGDETPPAGWNQRANPKDITVDLGAGDDVLLMIGVQARNGTIIGGSGFNGIVIQDNGGDNSLADGANFYGNLTITNGNDGYDIALAGINITKNCTVTLGNGGGTFGIYQSVRTDAGQPDPAFVSLLMGNLTITGGAGDDEVILSGYENDGDTSMLDIEGNLTVNLLGTTADGANVLRLDHVEIEGNMIYTGGAGADEIYLEREIWVCRNMTLNMGAGENLFDATVNHDETCVGGNFIYNGGAGTDTLLADGMLEFERNATFNLAGGDNVINFTCFGNDDVMWVGGNLLIKSNGGDDQVAFSGGEGLGVEGNATFALGGGENSLAIVGLSDGLWVMGNFVYTGGAGIDEITIDTTFGVFKNATFTLAGGDNIISITRGDEDDELIFVGGNLLITANGGNDQVTFSGGDGSEIRGNVTFTMGAGDNELLVESSDSFSVVGNLTYNSGAGADNVRFENCELEIIGNVTINVGAGANTVILTSIGEETMYVLGNFAFTGGAGDDLFLVEGESWIKGNLQVKAGNGDNRMETTGEFGVEGKFSYDGGTGIDLLDLKSLCIIGDTTIKTLDGDDVVAIYGDTSLRKLIIDTGNGNDKVFLGDDADQNGGWDQVIAKGPVAVALGGGDDELTLGYASGGEPTLLLLDESVKFDGGTNATANGDTLNVEDVFLAFMPITINWETVNV